MEDEMRREPARKSNKLLLIGAIALAVALTVGFFVALASFILRLIDRYELDEKTQTYLEAIIDADNDKLHSVSYDQTLDVRELISILAREEIKLEGEVEIKQTRSIQIGARNQYVAAKAVFTVRIGEAKYDVTIEYRKDDDGDGISSLLIRPR